MHCQELELSNSHVKLTQRINKLTCVKKVTRIKKLMHIHKFTKFRAGEVPIFH